jgi:hypothetical protein
VPCLDEETRNALEVVLLQVIRRHLHYVVTERDDRRRADERLEWQLVHRGGAIEEVLHGVHVRAGV